ncbi:MAG: endonuclease III [Polyangiaceae bacterium]|nr:endonuclease III [Polyangiaceae bacterium]
MARSRAASGATTTFARLRAQHPDAHCELDHHDPFTLLVSVVLSAQTTDVAVNQTTPQLFARWPTAAALATADVAEVEMALNRIGMFRQKARNIVALSRDLVDRHHGQVPRTLEELVALPGVGRKTANVVLGVAFDDPAGVVVDTHVLRLAQRLGWTNRDEPEGVERDLMALFPRDQWDLLGHTIIFHGRRVCTARKPACAACTVNDVCPSAYRADDVGRKPPRARRK